MEIRKYNVLKYYIDIFSKLILKKKTILFIKQCLNIAVDLVRLFLSPVLDQSKFDETCEDDLISGNFFYIRFDC
jgi:hypothetical protein